jgi:hypothetical protein
VQVYILGFRFKFFLAFIVSNNVFTDCD